MEAVNAIGRRKAAVARVFVTEGTGKIVINKRELEKLFPFFYPSVHCKTTVEQTQCVG